VTYYCVWAEDGADNEAHWVSAASADEARRLVALNGGDAALEAADVNKFKCVPSAEKTPPADFIHRRLHGPLAITRR
jgi:hypothetical protein